jgi:hypothetical protein
MNFRAVIFVALAGIAFQVSGQNSDAYIMPKIISEAPNSAAMAKFGNYKVNTFTGLPDISIPLYEIKAGEIKIPVTLSYHASGIRVTDAASWVGLGWALDAGGSISRAVQGVADELTGVALGYLQGYLKPNNYAFYTGSETDLSYLNEVRKRYYDTEPDIFSFSIPGKSGKFFFNGQDNFKIIQIPLSPVKIEKVGNLTFKITDEVGNVYQFGMDGSIETTTNNSMTYSISSGWMMNKIVSQSQKDTVTLSYTSEAYSLPGFNVDQINVPDQILAVGCGGYSSNTGTATYSTSSSYVTDRKQSVISYKGGKVVFLQSAANRSDMPSKKLDAIEVYNFDYATRTFALIKKILFHTSYFSNTRLKLDSLSFLDKKGIVVEKYRFTYNTAVNLPPITSRAQDYWGYFNGRTTNTSLVPETVIDYQSSSGGGTSNITISAGNNRNCDSLYMQANILTRITFPTGGYTDFEYQTNRYRDTDNQIKFAGGLRINAVKSYDGISGIPVTTTYQYGDGRANFILSNHFFHSDQTYRKIYMCGGVYGIQATKRSRTYQSNPNISIVPWDGCIVVYPKVTEYVGNGTANTGKTVYQYLDHIDPRNSMFGVIDCPNIESFFDQRGKILSQAEYKNVSGTYLPVKRVNYLYNTTSFPEVKYYGVGFKCERSVMNESDVDFDLYMGACEGQDACISDCYSFVYGFYHIRTDDNYPISMTEKSYDPTDTTKTLITTTTFNYTNLTHQQVTSSVTTTSEGTVKTHYSKFPADYGATGGFVKTMTDRNMQAVPVEKYSQVTNGTTKTVSGQVQTFRSGSLGALVPDYVKLLEIPTPVSNFVVSSVSGSTLTVDSRYKTYVTFDKYDRNNNIVRYTPRNAPTTGILWGYQSYLPVAQIVSPSDTNYAYAGFETLTDKGRWTYAGIPQYNVAAKGGKCYYLLSGGNMTLLIGKAGKYRLQYWAKAAITISGGTVVDINTSSADNNGWIFYEKAITIASNNTTLTLSGSTSIDEVRLYPSDAQMTTYTYEPQLGMSGQADPNCVPSYYEYDDYGRLRSVKDQDGNILQNHYKLSY